MPKTPTKPCSCWEHQHHAPTELGKHTFVLETRADDAPISFLEIGWRFICSCGGRGHWQYQSPSVAYHCWLAHVERYPHTTKGVKERLANV